MSQVEGGRPESGGIRVGVLGGGQLGRMMALAGRPLGVRFRFLEPGPDPPVTETGQVIRAAYDDPAALERLGAGLDVVTFEFENVPSAALRHLSGRVPVRPGPKALAVARDRAREKALFRELGIETAPHLPVDGPEDLPRVAPRVGFPGILKRRTLGYDGKGQVRIEGRGDLDGAWEAIGGVPAIYEAFVPFDRELSVVGVRGAGGEVRFYPLTENRHREGILVMSRAPAGGAGELARLGESYLGRLMEHLGYVGVLALELFQRGEELLANEFAPRVHNSGHWTQDGALTSQFENHVRAVTGLPLGSTELVAPTTMVNLLGRIPALPPLLRIPGAHVHLYEKAPRPGRKLGHVNVRGSSEAEREERVRKVAEVMGVAAHG